MVVWCHWPCWPIATHFGGQETFCLSQYNGNVVVTIQQDSINPLAPLGTAGIRSDVTITVSPNGSSITTVGAVSGSHAFELNVFGQFACNVQRS
jgi:hypothetical protein